MIVLFLILASQFIAVNCQFKNERFLKRKDEVLLKSSEKKKGPILDCGSDKITISFDHDEMRAMHLKVPGQG